MKFIVSSTGLFSHLQAISRVINSKNSLPILDCFLMELTDGTLSLTASDSETTLSTSLEVNESDGDGRFAVSSKTILEALKEIPEQPLTFLVNTENLEITVQYQNGKYSLMGQNADEYPQAPALGANAVHVTMGAPVMLAGINRSLFATADDELRPVMNGIYFDITTEDITFVASDGHKLVRNKTFVAHGDEKAAFILPKKPATLLKNLLPKEQGDVQIDFDDRNATFTLENYSMICRLIEGRYPNYNSVIPQDNPHKATIDRMMLISALRRVSVFSSQASSLIKLRLSENQIQISAQDIDFSTSAEETLTCQYTGSPMSIGFKSTFLIDILNNISAQEILFELADPSRAGVIVPVEQEEKEEAAQPPKEVGFISVSVGKGMTEIFKELGVDYLIEGGQTMNPSTEDMLNAIAKVNAKTIYIFPNNKNIVLAANQARDLTEDKEIVVVPTKTIPQGITAMISYVPEKNSAENTEAMLQAIEHVKTGQITYAVRDTRIDDKEIHEGDMMGIGDHGILAVGKDRMEVAKETVAQMVDDESEVISIYYGADTEEAEAEELATVLEEAYPECDVELNAGGQPIYYYVISVE
jgi:DNA polymerase-3 subunit beta